MPTLDKTRLRDLIITTGDIIHSDDGSVVPPMTPAPLLARAGEDVVSPVSGASSEFRGGDGLVGTANGGAGTFRAGDGNSGGPAEFRAGDGSGAVGGPVEFRGGDGVTAGGPAEFRAGNATTGPGGVARFAAGDGTVGAPLALEAGDGTVGVGGSLSIESGTGPAGGGPLSIVAGSGSGGGSLSIEAGTGASFGGPLSLIAGNNTGTSGDGGGIMINAGSVTNLLGLGDGGDIDIQGGSVSGTGIPGAITMTTDDVTAPVGIRTTSGFAGTTLEQLTYGIQFTAVAGGVPAPVVTLGTLTSSGQNMKFNVWVTGADTSASGNIVSVKIEQTVYHTAGVPTLLTPHFNDIQGAGAPFSSEVSFSLAVSGSDIRLMVTNASSSTTYLLDVAVCWTRQEGGFSS